MPTKGENRAKDRRTLRKRLKKSDLKQVGNRRLARMNYGDGPTRRQLNDKNDEDAV